MIGYGRLIATENKGIAYYKNSKNSIWFWENDIGILSDSLAVNFNRTNIFVSTYNFVIGEIWGSYVVELIMRNEKSCGLPFHVIGYGLAKQNEANEINYQHENNPFKKHHSQPPPSLINQ